MRNHALNASHKRQSRYLVYKAKVVHDCIDKSVYCYSVSTIVNVVCIVQATCTMNIKCVLDLYLRVVSLIVYLAEHYNTLACTQIPIIQHQAKPHPKVKGLQLAKAQIEAQLSEGSTSEAQLSKAQLSKAQLAKLNYRKLNYRKLNYRRLN